MFLHEALHNLVGFPHLLACRIPGPILTLTRRMRVLDHQGPKQRPFTGCFADFVSIDWQVMKKEDFGKLMAQLAADARGAAGIEQEEGGNG